jgi:hypothetical protein
VHGRLEDNRLRIRGDLCPNLVAEAGLYHNNQDGGKCEKMISFAWGRKSTDKAIIINYFPVTQLGPDG